MVGSRLRTRSLLVALPLLVAACSADAETGSETGNINGNGEQNGAAFPATRFSLPQLVSSGGRVIQHPVLVPITFDGDPMRGDIEKFVSKLAGSKYWDTVAAEYKVGAAKAGTPIHVAERPGATVDQSELETWLASKLRGDSPEFGTPNPNAIYAIYYPAGTTIVQGGDKSCVSFGGFHGEIQAGSTDVPYVVMPRCASYGILSGLEFITFASSHEFLEAATDPLPGSNPAYYDVDPDHALWSL